MDLGTGIIFAAFLEKKYNFVNQYLASRFTLDACSFWGGKKVAYTILTKDYNMRQTSYSTDLQLYLYKPKSIYIFGGIGHYNKSVKDRLWDTTLRSYHISAGTFRRLGAGGYFTEHCGVEISSTTFDDVSKPWVALSLLLRF